LTTLSPSFAASIYSYAVVVFARGSKAALAAAEPSSTHAANTSTFSGAVKMIIDGVSGMYSKFLSLID
jgi:hypothetical protein